MALHTHKSGHDDKKMKGTGHLKSAHIQSRNIKRSSVAPNTKVKKGM